MIPPLSYSAPSAPLRFIYQILPSLAVKRSKEAARVCKGLAAETFVKPFCSEGFICTIQGMPENDDFQDVIGTTKRNLSPSNPSALITIAGCVFWI